MLLVYWPPAWLQKHGLAWQNGCTNLVEHNNPVYPPLCMLETRLQTPPEASWDLALSVTSISEICKAPVTVHTRCCMITLCKVTLSFLPFPVLPVIEFCRNASHRLCDFSVALCSPLSSACLRMHYCRHSMLQIKPGVSVWMALVFFSFIQIVQDCRWLAMSTTRRVCCHVYLWVLQYDQV